MNPFNLGCARNFKEIFCTGVPSSRIDFRAHAKVDRSSSFNTSSFLGGTATNSDMHKMKNFDVEVGRRQAVDVVECKETDSRIKAETIKATRQ